MEEKNGFKTVVQTINPLLLRIPLRIRILFTFMVISLALLRFLIYQLLKIPSLTLTPALFSPGSETAMLNATISVLSGLAFLFSTFAEIALSSVLAIHILRLFDRSFSS